MFSADDVKRFQRIGDAFEKIAFEFNAAAPPTDFLTLIVTKRYGSDSEEC